MSEHVPHLHAEDLERSGPVLLVDCREKEEVDRGMIPGAIWLPKSQADSLIPAKLPDKNAAIVVYCQAGKRSLTLAKLLLDLGYTNVRCLEGGIDQWRGDKSGLWRRYRSQMMLPEIGEEGQKKLRSARVLLVGAGGLGSPMALYLAGAGVGQLGIADFDVVDESNLHRQILHSTSRIGLSKVDSAIAAIQELNPEVRVLPHKQRMDASTIDGVIGDYDIVVDGADNFETRYLVNQACLKFGKINVHGSVYGFQGQVSVFCMKNGPCYRCLFDEGPSPTIAPNCAEGGVCGPVVGVTGSLVAVEVMKLILGHGEALSGKMLCYDGLTGRMESVRFEKRKNCPSCSVDPLTLSYEAVLSETCKT